MCKIRDYILYVSTHFIRMPCMSLLDALYYYCYYLTMRRTKSRACGRARSRNAERRRILYNILRRLRIHIYIFLSGFHFLNNRLVTREKVAVACEI